MEHFAKIVEGFNPLTIFARWFLLAVWKGFEYAYKNKKKWYNFKKITRKNFQFFKDAADDHKMPITLISNGQYFSIQPRLLLKPEPWPWTRNLDADPEKPGSILKPRSGPWKTWTQNNLDLEQLGLGKTWTLKNLDAEKYGPWKTWILKNTEQIWD